MLVIQIILEKELLFIIKEKGQRVQGEEIGSLFLKKNLKTNLWP